MTTTHQLSDLPQSLTLEAAEPVAWGDELTAAANGAGGTAGGEKLPSFSMTAYTGAVMRVEGFFRPVVVDLAGMKAAAKTIPALRNHDPDRIVGHGEPVISANDVTVTGLVSADNEHARDIRSSARNGFPWEVSVGLRDLEFEFLKADTKATVNGKAVSGPLLIARKSLLREVSFVPLGADRKTKSKITAAEADGAAERSRHATQGLTVSAGKSGVWIEGHGTIFLSASELDRLRDQLRSH